MSRLQIPGMGMPQQGPPQVAVAAPLNDTQLVCLMAAELYPHMTSPTNGERVEDAVDFAQEIMAEAILTSDRVTAKVLAKRKALEAM